MKWLLTIFCVLLLLASHLVAQGGPPFRTDDPDTPGNRHWEINMGFIGERNRFEGSYSTPNIDVNYGLGERIQLKYELPLSIAETRGESGRVSAGLGNSLLGVKWRFLDHGAHTPSPDPGRKIAFALSTYPQLIFNNPTRSLNLGIVEPAPQFLLPLEANVSFGPLRAAAEAGYWFATKGTPNSWITGLIVGHVFGKATEVYGEFRDQGEVGGGARETTLGIGGRQPLTSQETVLLIGMAGRRLTVATATNGQPDWIAYIGLQVRIGPGPKK